MLLLNLMKKEIQQLIKGYITIYISGQAYVWPALLSNVKNDFHHYNSLSECEQCRKLPQSPVLIVKDKLRFTTLLLVLTIQKYEKHILIL